MGRWILALTILASLCTIAFAQHSSDHPKAPAGEKPVTRMAGMGSIHHPVSTKNEEAQEFFNQGLAFVYAFNHDEAIRSFKRAAELDPNLAMAHWGIAFALGPNINLDVDPEREKAAYEAVQKALSLSTKAPENERAYIAALAKRYSIAANADLKKLAVDFKNAMGELSTKYPDDLDAATLYAEAAMNLRPWKLWTLDGKPAEGTEEIVAVLEAVLRRNPNHIGAIHYYLHAVEASPNPERGLAYAAKLPVLIPAAGHLVHMPAHIYARTGDYEAAALSNKQAAEVDEAYFKASGSGGVYPFMYYCHNLHFLAVANSMIGRSADAIAASKRLDAYIAPHVKGVPMLEGFAIVTPLILVRFSRWDDIEKLPPPDSGLASTTAVWHFARGMAFDAKGRTADARREYALMVEAENKVPAEASFGLNNARNVLKIAEYVLGARIVRMTKNDTQPSIELLRKAVALEDALAYDEPSPWLQPVRESLGGLLLKAGDYPQAEQVFRADLEKNKRSGRSLFGLMHALKAQGKDYSAAMVEREFDIAWAKSDTQLRIEDLQW